MSISVLFMAAPIVLRMGCTHLPTIDGYISLKDDLALH